MFLALQQAATRSVFDTDISTYGLTGTGDVLGAWLICFLTLAVFSFLYRDNPFYKIAEHLFVGVGTAWYALQYYEEGIIQPLYEHIALAGEASAAGEPMSIGGYLLAPGLAVGLRVVPIVLGLMLLSRLFSGGAWLARWPLALMVGIYAALKMTGEVQSKLVLQVKETFVPVVDPDAMSLGDWFAADPRPLFESTGFYFTFGRVIFLVGLICALGHFIFTFRHSPTMRAISRVGVITLMITFGSMFGFTVLGRIALLIERISDLNLYWDAPYSPFGVDFLSPPLISGVIITLLLAIGAARRRGAPPA